jgi:alkaline phosphatase
MREFVMNKLLILATAATLTACTSVDTEVSLDSPQDNATVDVSEHPKTNEWYSQGQAAVAQRANIPLNTNKAKNVILFIADGMGISTITAARIYDGQSRGETGEENSLSFESFPSLALVKTYNTDAQVPDSAGTASAMNTGVKTAIGVISQAADQQNECYGPSKDFPKTIAEIAEAKGLATGIVSTASITHATPAAVYAHSPTRDWEADANIPADKRALGCQDIAQQLVQFSTGDGIDVALGGGKRYFYPNDDGGKRKDGRDLVDEWQQKYTDGAFVTNAEELSKATKTNDKLFGLFSSKHMAFEADRSATQEPSLTEMTSSAIDVLSRNKDGYFLMVESGRVDHAHHATNAYRALTDAQEFSRAVQAAVETVNLDETLILVTADHSHVFTIAGYPERGNPILGFVAWSDGGSREYTNAADGKPYTTLGYHNGPNATTDGRKEVTEEEVLSDNYLQETAIEMSSETHSGEDVALFAVGPWSHLVNGVIEQNEIFHIIDHAMGLTK